MNHKTFIGVIIILIILVACDNKQVFEDYYSAGNDGWNKDSIAEFSFTIETPEESCNLLISSRNLENYPYSNLWLFIDMLGPDSTLVRDTIEYEVALPNGKWTGKGTSGVYLNQYMFRPNVYFPLAGEYKISIQHAMRNDILIGLRNIGVRVEKR